MGWEHRLAEVFQNGQFEELQQAGQAVEAHNNRELVPWLDQVGHLQPWMAHGEVHDYHTGKMCWGPWRKMEKLT